MLADPKLIRKISAIETTYDALRYRPIRAVDVEFCETREHYRTVPPDDCGLEWMPVAEGHHWGDSWVTGWFRGTVTIPEELDGHALFIRASTGGRECLFLVDGRHYGVFDRNHPVRLLTSQAVGSRTYQIHLESYAGHSFPGTQPYDQPIVVSGGADQDGAITIVPSSRIFGGIHLVAENADVSAFVFELRALRQLAQALDEHSLRRGRIFSVLEAVLARVYAKPEEVDEEVWRSALADCRDVMRPALAQKNGPTTPEFGIIGHSHIDTAWLWPLAETYRKLARTFSSVLALMDQYPDFQFTQSAAYHADIVERLYPEIFSRIQERVREGRWEINGAAWIEPDCNIPSGESLVRQFLFGQRATRRMFGVTSDTLWQPDVFGYSAALPQILQGVGVRYFCTTKLGWNDTNRFPYDTFVWEGLDGSSVLAHFNRIHCSPDPETLLDSWRQVQHKDVQDRRLIAFGYGDGGGGPMAEMIEMGRLSEDLEGCPRAKYTSITEFMDSCRDDLANLPHWAGELYLELHRGTLTSMAAIKRGNRKCELALRDAEFAATLAALSGSPIIGGGGDQSRTYPAEALNEAWKTLLTNQFHDILPGTSIAEVNDQAVEELAGCLAEAERIRDEAFKSLSGVDRAQTLLIANSLGWDRAGELDLTGLSAGCRPAGKDLIFQEYADLDGHEHLVVHGLTIPALGYAAFPAADSRGMEAHDQSPFTYDGDTIETPFAQIVFDKSGSVVSFYDKSVRRELVIDGGRFNGFLLGEDVPAAWDNWDIDRDQAAKMQWQDALVDRAVVADGPLQLRLRQSFRIGRSSVLTQDIVFHATTPRVDFETQVDWREKHQFLKVAFETGLLIGAARHEVQFGHVTRSTHDNTSYDRAQFDVCAHKWTDLAEGQYGIAFLNDCKYACTVRGGRYTLSLLKSGRHPDPRGDEGVHRFSYALLPHQGGFSVENIVRPAHEFNAAPCVVSVALKPSEPFSLVAVSAPNVIVEAVKMAEDGEGFVLRLYEAGMTGTHATLTFGVPVTAVRQTNLLEEEPENLPVSANAVETYFRPFEIKTLRVYV